ncbi:MAG: hypothetical protein J5865_04960 [Lachnospiraceae bacterium]|nr:hypothetical protein [Lachnospiraceae bacterium]
MAIKRNSGQIKKRYLSAEMAEKRDKRQSRMMRWGGGLLIFFLLALFGTFLPDNDDPTHASTVVLIIIGIAAGLGLIIWAYFTGREIETARQYERMFAADRNGEVTLAELARLSGKTPEKVERELDRLFSRNLFENCVLQRTGEPMVLINDAQMEGPGLGFVFVRCASCGGVSRIREGSRGKCQFCGAPVADEGVTE